MNTIDSNTKAYLYGNHLSNALNLKLNKPNNKLHGRAFILESLIKEKNIIHFGCADHIELIEDKIKNDTWLHSKLERKAAKTTGLDINCEAIQYLKEKHQIDSVFCYNIYNDELPKEITKSKYDYLILGEILEHVDNPVAFLEKINVKFKNHVSKIIITVPNFLRLKNIMQATKNSEYINSDHRFWFSPYTLSKICAEANIEPMGYTFYVAEKYNIVYRQLLKRFNLFQDGIIWIGKLN